MHGLDGVWSVRRTGGFLPPLFGVRKVIRGDRGQTWVGPLIGVPFRVEGRELRYLAPLAGFVDLLEGEGDTLQGRATFRGRELGRFEMSRITVAAPR